MSPARKQQKVIDRIHEVLNIINEAFKEVDATALRPNVPDYSLISSMILFDVVLLFVKVEPVKFPDIKFLVEAGAHAILVESNDNVLEEQVDQIAALMTASLNEYKRVVREENLKQDHPEPKVVQAKQVETKKWLN